MNSHLNQRKDEIFMLISKDNFNQALAIADVLFKEGDRELYQQFILLNMRVSRIKNESLKGTITRDQMEIDERKEASNFLTLLEELK